jgi:hypothetical protein
MANVSQPMFGSAAVVDLLAQFGEEIFGSKDFVRKYLPLASQGKFIKHSIMSILFMLTYRVKIDILRGIELTYKPAQLRNDIKSMSPEQIEQLKQSLTIPDSGFSAEVAAFFRGERAIHDYFNDDGVLGKQVNESGVNIEDALQHAAEIKAEIDKTEVEDFDLENFKSYQVTRLLHNICVSKVPSEELYGDLFSAQEYADAADYFAVIGNSKDEGFEQLRESLLAESDSIEVVAAQLRKDKENLKKPITNLLSIIEKDAERRREEESGRRKSSRR